MQNSYFIPNGENNNQIIEKTFIEYFSKKINVTPRLAQLPYNIINDVNDWHMSMINDLQRNDAYKKTINKIVNYKDLVLEIGTGSGLLSLLAAKSGAKHVYAIEASKDFSEIARVNFEYNNLEKKISIVQGMSTYVFAQNNQSETKKFCKKDEKKIKYLIRIFEKVHLQVKASIKCQIKILKQQLKYKQKNLKSEHFREEKKLKIPYCNVLIGEILGTLLDGESFIHYYQDARKRLLKKDAKIIPVYGAQYCTLISSETFKNITQANNYKEINLQCFNKLRDSTSLVFSKNFGILINTLKYVELTKPILLFEIDLQREGVENISLKEKTVETISINFGESVALMYWWEVYMDNKKTIKITTNPYETKGNVPRDLNWGQGLQLVESFGSWFEPRPTNYMVQKGDKIYIKFTIDQSSTYHGKIINPN